MGGFPCIRSSHPAHDRRGGISIRSRCDEKDHVRLAFERALRSLPARRVCRRRRRCDTCLVCSFLLQSLGRLRVLLDLDAGQEMVDLGLEARQLGFQRGCRAFTSGRECESALAQLASFGARTWQGLEKPEPDRHRAAGVRLRRPSGRSAAPPRPPDQTRCSHD